MKNKLILFFVWLSFAGPLAAQGGGKGKDTSSEFTRSNPKFLAAFKGATARPSVSTVRILVSGKETALGVVVGPDGWILTKANDVQDFPGLITVRFREGKTYEAEIAGLHTPHDLALLKIEARGLVPIEFKESKLAEVGSWIACVGLGDEPVAVGVISVATRNVANKGPAVDKSKMPFLGVTLQAADKGGVRIVQLTPDTPAVRIGLKVGDVILQLAGNKVDDPEGLMQVLGKFKPGNVVMLKVLRGTIEMEKTAKLEKRPPGESRGDIQNSMGSDLSGRNSGYATILQHDSVVKREDCGGPIVDLEGRVLGINISRAGRVESWAIPSEVIQPILAELRSGKLAPQLTPEEKLAKAKKAVNAAVSRADLEKNRFEKDIDEARRALQSAETEFKAYRHKDAAESAERILKLMQERLVTMNAVAGWKWNHRTEILDPARESAALKALQKRAKELNIEPALVDRFFKAQIEAARLLQEERIASLQKDSLQATVKGTLVDDLRPHIDVLNDELLATLAKVVSYWNDAELNVQGRIRQLSTQVVAGQGISPTIRAKALEGLLAP